MSVAMEIRDDHRRPPLPHWHAAGKACRWCGSDDGGTDQFGGHEYAVGGYWHEACLTAYATAVSSKAQRLFVEKRDLGLCAGCGANAERAMFHAMQNDPNPPFYGWEVVRVMKRWIDPEFHCVANSTWFRRAPAPAGVVEKLPPWMTWEADHIVPLWSVDRTLPWEELQRFWSLDNLQTLCSRCHKRKSAREAAERAALKRGPDAQMGLLLTGSAA
ncbi:hypothetical protein J2847_005842 [Azospirillum agricola]|uniref:HNH endonuclease n=1 Tax=Azospirillum agricola TaxID=1720247 RepID=UPI001AE196A7|nr:HNH endonuclease [Azospirillum agricola]MBP2232513.1 hypothetical protein [Azospirillum agricola]